MTNIRTEEQKLHTLLTESRKEEDAELKNKLTIEKQLRNLGLDQNNLEREINKLTDEIQKCKYQASVISEGKSDKVTELTEQLSNYLEEETALREKLQIAIDNKAEVEVWLTHFKSFKSFLANKSITSIQDYCNYYLQQMGSKIEILLEGYKVLSNKKLKEEISVTVKRGLDAASYGTYSGGEKGRVDISCNIAIQTLINLNSPTGGLDLLILDEVMDSVDSLGLENIIRSLQNIDRTIMIVSQVEVLSIKEHTITIIKQNRKSTIA